VTAEPLGFELACDFLREQLADGPQPSRELLALGRARGFGDDLLRKAKEALEVEHRRIGYRRDSYVVWSLAGWYEENERKRRAEARERFYETATRLIEADEIDHARRQELKRLRDAVARRLLEADVERSSERPCEACGRAFTPKKRWGRFCGRTCEKSASAKRAYARKRAASA
jgi:hypothetical protein